MKRKRTISIKQIVAVVKDRALYELQCFPTYLNANRSEKARIEDIGKLLSMPNDTLDTIVFAKKLNFFTGDEDEYY